jgi:phage shock protein E
MLNSLKFIFLWTLLSSTIFVQAQTIKPLSKQQVQRVGPKVFSERIQKGSIVLLDVRTPGEYKKGHIRGARLLDIFSDDFEKELNKLDRKATYMVYCGIGGRSEECSEMMRKKGFVSVYDLDGGIKRWQAEGFPVEQ